MHQSQLSHASEVISFTMYSYAMHSRRLTEPTAEGLLNWGRHLQETQAKATPTSLATSSGRLHHGCRVLDKTRKSRRLRRAVRLCWWRRQERCCRLEGCLKESVSLLYSWSNPYVEKIRARCTKYFVLEGRFPCFPLAKDAPAADDH